MSFSDRANNKHQGPKGFILHAHQVIGNVEKTIITLTRRRNSEGNCGNSQLEQRQVREAIHEFALTLLHDVFLKDGRRLGVVPVESVQYRVNVLWPVRRIIEGDSHVCGGVGMLGRRLGRACEGLVRDDCRDFVVKS